MQRLQVDERSHAPVLAPDEEIRHSAAIGAPRMRTADADCEEFEEAALRLLAGGHDDQRQRSRVGDRNELVH